MFQPIGTWGSKNIFKSTLRGENRELDRISEKWHERLKNKLNNFKLEHNNEIYANSIFSSRNGLINAHHTTVSCYNLQWHHIITRNADEQSKYNTDLFAEFR